jgi:hypothetical protein
MMNAAFGTKFSAVITEGSKDNEVLLLNGCCDMLIGNIGEFSGVVTRARYVQNWRGGGTLSV